MFVRRTLLFLSWNCSGVGVHTGLPLCQKQSHKHILFIAAINHLYPYLLKFWWRYLLLNGVSSSSLHGNLSYVVAQMLYFTLGDTLNTYMSEQSKEISWNAVSLYRTSGEYMVVLHCELLLNQQRGKEQWWTARRSYDTLIPAHTGWDGLICRPRGHEVV